MTEQPEIADHVIAVHLAGKVTQPDIQRWRETMERVLATHDRIAVYVDLTGLSDFSADAIAAGTKADLQLLTHIRRLERIAFVSDKEWPEAITRYLTPWLPTVQVRHFAADERDQAATWAAESNARHPAHSPAIRFIPTTDSATLAFEIDGTLSAEEIPGIVERLDAFLTGQDRVRILARIRHLRGFDPNVLFKSGFLATKLEAARCIERYAVVGAPAWMKTWMKTVRPLFPDMDMQTFTHEHEADAWQWLETRPSRAEDQPDEP